MHYLKSVVYLVLSLILLPAISQASLPGSLGTALVSQKEKDRAQDTINSQQVTIRTYSRAGTPPKWTITTTPVNNFSSNVATSTDIVRRLSMFNEDLLSIFPRYKVLGYVQNLWLCVEVGCGSALKNSKTIVQGVTPANFHYNPDLKINKEDKTYFLDYREERLADIHEFAHFINFNENVTGFKNISWSQFSSWSEVPATRGNPRYVFSQCRKPEVSVNFVSSYACLNNYSEDFADTVGWYVMRRTEFLRKAQASSVLQAKYDWVKNNIFNGLEFTDDVLRRVFNR